MKRRKIYYLASLYTSALVSLTKSKDLKTKVKTNYHIEEGQVKTFGVHEQKLFLSIMVNDSLIDNLQLSFLRGIMPKENYEIVSENGYYWITNTVPVEVKPYYVHSEKKYYYWLFGEPIITKSKK